MPVHASLVNGTLVQGQFLENNINLSSTNTVKMVWSVKQAGRYRIALTLPTALAQQDTQHLSYAIYLKGYHGNNCVFPVCIRGNVNLADTQDKPYFLGDQEFVLNANSQLTIDVPMQYREISIAFVASDDPRTPQNTPPVILSYQTTDRILWHPPAAGLYRLWIQIPAAATGLIHYCIDPATSSLANTSLNCDSHHQVTINQTHAQGQWRLLQNTAHKTWELSSTATIIGALSAPTSIPCAPDSAATACETPLATLSLSAIRFESMQALRIGQRYQGGFIFYLDKTQKHGLIAAPSDQSDSVEFGHLCNSLCPAVQVPVLRYSGLVNTDMILRSDVGFIKTADYAAKYCDQLQIGGYQDWYLPSSHELQLMMSALGMLNNTGFKNQFYWSSSTDPQRNYHIIVRKPNGARGSSDGYRFALTHAVRAIRSF